MPGSQIMRQNQVCQLDPAILHKARKLGVTICDESDDDGLRLEFRHRGKLHVCYSERCLEDQIDDLLDGGAMREREAEQAERFEDNYR
jgi:hypothetical protein